MPIYVLVHHAQNGETALYYACWKGHSQIVALLAQARADVNQQNKVREVDVVHIERSTPCTYKRSPGVCS